MLIVATLSGFVYAFDTSTPPSGPNGGLLWSVNLPTDSNHCGQSGGSVFVNNQYGFPGVRNLPYYGIVATPMIDTAADQQPTAFVTSACVKSADTTSALWFLDAIDLTRGQIATGTNGNATIQIMDGTNCTSSSTTNQCFYSANQISRASLLLTHPGSSKTYVYAAFGDGVREIGALDAAGANGNTWRYSGVLFVFPYTYGAGQSFSSNLTPVFYTSCMKPNFSDPTNGCKSSGLFPSVYATDDGNGYSQAGPAWGTGCTNYCCTVSSGKCCLPSPGSTNLGNCSTGSNWILDQGGVWMSSGGLASTAVGNAYVASGNGPFACTDNGNSNCLDPTAVQYWAESLMQFPAGNATSPTSPQDFFAPYVQRYKQILPSTPPPDPNPAATQTQELSRMDQDFGVGRVVIIAKGGSANFVATADKAGFLYVTPPAKGEGNTAGLGQFQQSDAGLNGSSLTYQTQLPALISRNPSSSIFACPTVNANGQINATNGSCDEIHELAFNNDLLLVWPSNETVEMFPGTFTQGTVTSYTFGTRYEPCPGAQSCAGFPKSDSVSSGGAMAIAANNTASPQVASLWSIVPLPNAATNAKVSVGTLYAYEICTAGEGGLSRNCPSSVPGANLVPLWNYNPNSPPAKCSSPPLTGWYATSFTEPSVAEIQTSGSSKGAVYVPIACGRTDNFTAINYVSCDAVPMASVASGVAVFTQCP
jgi:hypothetical protein